MASLPAAVDEETRAAVSTYPGIVSTASPRIVNGEVVAERYRIQAELGRGGMSVVYRAHDDLKQRDVALKVLRLPEEDPSGTLFLQQEFRAMARLSHPRLVQVYDYGLLDSGAPFFTMELLGGIDLSQAGRLPLDRVFHVLISIAEVLSFMHARGYVHRDVKPANVRVLNAQDGKAIEVKLMDCGLTMQLGGRQAPATGTLPYLAPELWLGAPADISGDLYALGVLAYEITSGSLPFDVSSRVGLLQAKTQILPELRELCPDIPAAFSRLVGDLLAPEPSNRPSTAVEVLARLSQFTDLDFNPDPAVYLMSPALVGRTRELGQLRTLLQGTEVRPTSVMIVGPAGAGKTRLLNEALLEMGLRGSLVARTVGRGFGGRPYGALQELLGPLLHAPGAADVLARIGGKTALIPATSGAATGHRTGDPTAARRSFHAALTAFLDGASALRPIVLAIDDIHVADSASLDALSAALAGAGHGALVLVGTIRAGEPIGQTLEQLLSQSRRMMVGAMTAEQVEELIVRTLGPVTPNPGLTAEIQRASGGNVYFVLEILRNLATRGLIRRKRTTVSMPDALPELPRSLSEALERRVASLCPSAMAVARVVAIARRNLDLQLARTLAELTDETFLDAIDELRRSGLVEIKDLHLQVHHPRVREVVTEGMTIEERELLHRRVAEVLERGAGLDRHELAAELGHHYAEGGDRRKALHYLVMAGDVLFQGFAHFDAGEVYRRAIELLDAAPQRRRRALQLKLTDRIGRIAFYHDQQGAAYFLERAWGLHLRHGILWAIPWLSRLLGATVAVAAAMVLSALWNGLRLRRRPWLLAQDHLLDSLGAACHLCNSYTYSGRPSKGLAAAARLEPFMYSRRRLAWVAYQLARADALLYIGRFVESTAAAEDALQLLERDHRTPLGENERVHATGGALVIRLWNDLLRGHVRDSEWWKPFNEYVRSHPTALLEAWQLQVRVFAAHRSGSLAATRAAWQGFVQKATPSEMLFVQGKGRVWLGMAYLDAGYISEAQDVADDAIRAARDRDNPMLLAMGLLLRGRTLHAWEHLADAQNLLREALALVKREDTGCYELRDSILLAQAEVYFDTGDFDQAEELGREVEERSRSASMAHDLHRIGSLRLLGCAALRRGSLGKAADYLAQAHEIALKLDDPLELALAAHYWAEALALGGDMTGAEGLRTECRQILGEIDNFHRLRQLGYATATVPNSARANELARELDQADASECPASRPSGERWAALGDTQGSGSQPDPSCRGDRRP